MNDGQPSLAKATVGLAVLISVIAAGFGYLSSRSGDSTAGTEPAESRGGSNDVLLDYTKSGGFTGEVLRIVVRTDGTADTTREVSGKTTQRQGHLSANAMARLEELFVEAPWPTDDRSFDDPGETVADGYVYDITYEGVRVSAADMHPGWLLDLAEDVEKVASTVFAP